MPETAPAATAAAAVAVAAVVTAYRPGDRLVPLVRALLAQAATVVVVDDTGGAPDAEGPLVEAEAAGARVVRHRSNRGIAAALNSGIAAARTPERGASPRFVLTFDQDSAIGDDFVATLVATFEQAMAAGLPVGLVAPARIEGLPSQVTGYSRGFLLGTTPIQSGMLLPATTLDRVGGFAEPLFIDGVDTDYALRVAACGLRVLLADRATLGHSLGDRFHPALLTRLLALAGRPPIGLVVSRPFRYYYLLRNRVLLNRRHSRGALGWALRETLGDLRHCAIVLALAPGRTARLRAMAAGLRDGWASRTGRIPAPLERRLR
ncbi:glycosyltransferase [Herbiconiux sp. CPCC 203407]|uniref:Glycosyltransferase n=1 Tax=Herbiconiux oxytropis TaxID=2970915 RepID=A0AA42BUR2_9MICO|nr:glycosyltransferase [Herbiconiux oxytropis]MCS5722046.1 glycosyltransferase [Herbiconiux oxytropis]MCS5725629.1 glycosyltransferase [Herbiconiux oxytropis]